MNDTSSVAPPAGPEIAGRLRDLDPVFYYASLFCPAEKRPAIQALYALTAELDHLPDRVNEPGLGEIRLKWWREAIERAAYGGPPEAPLVGGVASAIVENSLPLDPVIDMIEARIFDLYSDPQPTMVDLEGYFGETVSVVFQLAALILDPDKQGAPEAAGHAGVAFGLTRRLANFSHERARGRTIMPADLMAEFGVSKEDISGIAQATNGDMQGSLQSKLLSIIAALSTEANHHYALAKADLTYARSVVKPAFLPISTLPGLLRSIDRAGPNILTARAEASNLRALTQITLAALKGQ